jgi:hypothetical protein
MGCISCGSDREFEKRGDRRCYAAVTLDDPEIDGWDEGDEIEWDTDHAGREVIYCVECDAEQVIGAGGQLVAPQYGQGVTA